MKHWILALTMLCMVPEGILDVAKRYIDTPYAAGTLEAKGEERLVVNEDSVDCTTFVELSVARWLSAKKGNLDFEEQVQQLRYRGAIVDGYLSRLHYFTDWVEENTRRGVWHELAPTNEDNTIWHTDTLNLSFMSEHPQSYPYLSDNPWAIDSLRSIEQRYAHHPIYYIGKEHLGLTSEELPIKDGDIVALVTTIEGLDVTHLGFAIWRGETLHLMHASMKHGKVVIDERSLYEYLQGRKSCPGVRVVRLRER